MPVIDTDERVQKRVGLSIARMVEERGWEFFRRHEREVIAGIAFQNNSIIATGGGAVEDGDNRRIISDGNTVVWLSAEGSTIAGRMVVDGKSCHERPPLSNALLLEEIEKIMEKRAPLYREIADIEIDANEAGAAGVAAEILDYMRNRRGKECRAIL
jgi:shikimate kinase